VIDPFMGSGSVGESALRAGRIFYGNDLSPTAVDLCRERLASGPQSNPPDSASEGETDGHTHKA
jgi:DNA modification methylase